MTHYSFCDMTESRYAGDSTEMHRPRQSFPRGREICRRRQHLSRRRHSSALHSESIHLLVVPLWLTRKLQSMRTTFPDVVFRCFDFTSAGMDLARHNACVASLSSLIDAKLTLCLSRCYRHLRGEPLLPMVAFTSFKSKYEPPTLSEGPHIISVLQTDFNERLRRIRRNQAHPFPVRRDGGR